MKFWKDFTLGSSIIEHLSVEVIEKQLFEMNNSTYTNLGDRASCRLDVSIFFTTAIAIMSSAAFLGNILCFRSVQNTKP